MKIGIITWHNYPNVGSALQAYALHTFINRNGGDATIINYSPFGRPSLWLFRLIASFFDKLLPKKLSSKLHYRFISFEHKYFRETKLYKDNRDLKKNVEQFDIFVCGSDQIWAPNVFNDVYMLSFVPDNKIKVSYAASIGLPEIPEKLIPTYKALLNRFDNISVRERQGADLLYSSLGINSTVVLDPTLLLKKEDWLKIGNNKKNRKPYVLCYFLGEQESHRKIVESFAKSKNYDVICISRYSIDIRINFITDTDVGPREFIDYVRFAEYVFTDSFHGLCFSVNFNKNFFVLKRFTEDSPINQNSRIENILSLLGLENQLISETPQSVENIDYNLVNKRLEKLRDNSHQYLREALHIK